jgi:hypothetical protein
MSANLRVWAIHAASDLPARSAADAKQNGIANDANPASTTGGWISIPPSRSTGLRPNPSGGVIANRSNGLATSTRTTSKKLRIAAMIPVA